MTIDKTVLETEIQSDIDNLNLGSSTQCIFEVAYATDKLCDDRKSTISCVANLPDLNTGTIPPGTIVYPEDVGIPIMAAVQEWRGLDGRTYRKDIPDTTIWGVGYNGQRNVGTAYNLCGTGHCAVCWYPNASQSCFISSLDTSSLSIGQYHGGFLDKTGKLWMFGYQSQGRLGDGGASGSGFEYARETCAGGTDWCCVQIGGGSSHGIKTDGSYWVWGLVQDGIHGGSKDNVCYSSPTCFNIGITDWAKVCRSGMGSEFSVIKSDGTMWWWGSAGFGAGMHGCSTNMSSPVQEYCSATNWCATHIGSAAHIAIKTDGTAWSAGRNLDGSLGINSTASNVKSAVQEASGGTDWCAAGTGYYKNTWLKNDGTLWQAGRGSCTATYCAGSISSPVQEITSSTTWCWVTGPDNSPDATWALKTDGTMWSWGNNTNYQIGAVSAIGSCTSSPIQENQSFTDWVNVKHGSYGAIAARETF